MIKPDQPFIVHHIEGRRSERVAWLCEELGLPYELKFVSGDVSGSLRALAKAHVMRMAPILEDGPVKMVESGAILEYILVRYGGGVYGRRPTPRRWPTICNGCTSPRAPACSGQ
jgi:glutathione S-transferase